MRARYDNSRVRVTRKVSGESRPVVRQCDTDEPRRPGRRRRPASAPDPPKPSRRRPLMNEFWLSGPVEGVQPLLVPAVHTFLQVRHDVRDLLSALSIEQLWMKFGQSAPIGFHAVHIAGATDRLLTYARGDALSDAQLDQLRNTEQSISGLDGGELISRVERAMDAAIAQLRATKEATLLEPRQVGRKRLPSTTLGLIAHAAEHAYRHAGQIATLRRIVLGSRH